MQLWAKSKINTLTKVQKYALENIKLIQIANQA